MTGTVTIHVHPALAAGAPAGDELAARRRAPRCSALDPIRAGLADMDCPARRAAPANQPIARPPGPSTGPRR